MKNNHKTILQKSSIMLLVIVCGLQVSAQQYPSINPKNNSLGSSDEDYIRQGFKDSDKNIVILATTATGDIDIRNFHGGEDLWVTKINGNTGDTVWISRAYGGLGDEGTEEVGNGFSLGKSLKDIAFETSDGNYLFTVKSTSGDGDVRGSQGSSDFWIFKLNSKTGDTLWTSRALGGSRGELPYNTIETSDGNYVITGTSSSLNGDVRGGHGGIGNDIWTVKLDSSNGDTIWTSRAIGGTDDETVSSLFEDESGNIILGGSTKSTDGDLLGKGYHGGTGYDMWLIKLNGVNGNLMLSSKALGGSAGEYGEVVFSATDGHYMFIGETGSTDGDVRGFHPGIGFDDIWLIKIDSSTLDTMWTSRAFGGTAAEVVKTGWAKSDGNFVIIGTTSSNDGDVIGANGGRDYWALIIDSTTKDILVSNSIGGNGDEELSYIESTCDGGYLFSGETYTGIANGDVTQSLGGESIWMVKTNVLFQVQWDKGSKQTSHHEEGLGFETNSGFIVVGGKKGNGQVYTFKFEWVDAKFIADTVCLGGPTTFTDSTKGLLTAMPGVDWYWDFGDLSSSADTSILQNPQYTYPDTGTYLVTQIVHKECQWDTFFNIAIISNVTDLIADAGIDTFICNSSDMITIGGSPTATGGEPGYTYVWDNGAANIANPLVGLGTYHLIVTDTNLCINSDSIVVMLAPPLISSYSDDDTICANDSVQLWALGLPANQPNLQYTWTPSTGLNNPAIENPIAIPSNTITYQIIISSQCESDTNSITVMVNVPPILTIKPADTTIKSGEAVLIEVLPAGLTYIWNPLTGLSDPTSNTPLATPATTTTYTITATDSNGCSSNISSLITIKEEDFIVWLPTIFSPNGDGNNDFLIARYVSLNSKGIKQFTLLIYDRWGKKVFEQSGTPTSNTLVQWDGTFNGKNLNTGVYVWHIQVSFDNNTNEETFLTGNVTLIR